MCDNLRLAASAAIQRLERMSKLHAIVCRALDPKLFLGSRIRQALLAVRCFDQPYSRFGDGKQSPRERVAG